MQCGGALIAASVPEARNPGSYTPEHLSRKILTSRSALVGERKQVTVFFADVKGSVALSRQVDAERWHEILDRFFQILAAGVHRFEGTLNQFTGDGVMALFGAPIAHEDHAQRACYAALHLERALRVYADELRRTEGLNFSVRMGLNSGEVVVGKIGDDLRMDYTAQGHTVGLAARIQEVAPADTVYLGETTANLVSGYFELADRGEFDLKGAVRKVRLVELRGLGEFRSRLEQSKARGFSRFLGRDKEMLELQAALDKALEGRAQVVAFVGEAGVGKSRLVYEFLQRCRERGIPCSQTHGVAHGRSIPLLPILELYRGTLGVRERDSAQEAREKIAGRIVLLDPELSESLPLVFDFLGIADPQSPARELSPEARQRKLIDFDVRYSIARSQREPMVTLYEDLHWMDEASLTWLAELVERAGDTRTLIIVNFRPEFLNTWNETAVVPANRLHPLKSSAVRELMEGVLGDDPSLVKLKEKIHARTLGNPFFFEEVVRTLIEARSLTGKPGAYRFVEGRGSLEIPSTVQSLLAARIDQLPEWEKRLLQIAAVAGRRVSRELFEVLVKPEWGNLDSALETLCAREFLVEVELYPEAIYEFLHPLTIEVAYGAQLSRRRARTHEATARAIEQIDGGKLGERAALLAHHWTQAERPLRSAQWHYRAAQWMRTQNVTAAMGHLRKSRQQLLLAEERGLEEKDTQLGVQVRLALLEIGVRCGLTVGEASEFVSEGRTLAERASDRKGLCLLLVAFGNSCIFGARIERGLAALREAEEVAKSLGAADLLVTLNITAAWSVMARGRLEEALRLNRRALDSLKALEQDEAADDSGPGSVGDVEARYSASARSNDGDESGVAKDREALGAQGRASSEDIGTRASLLAMRVGILRYLGRTDDAQRTAARLDALAIDADHSEWAGVVHGIRAIWGAEQGAFDAALRHAHLHQEIGVRSSNNNTRIHGQQSVSRVHSARGEWASALSSAEQSLAEVRDSGILHAEVGALCCIARAQLGAGNAAAALATAREATSIAHERDALHEVEGLLLTSSALRATGGPESADEIESVLAAASEGIDETGARAFQAELHLEAAELADMRGDREVARREYERAAVAFTERGATYLARQVFERVSES